MINNGVDIEEVLHENVQLPESYFGMGNYNNSHYFMLPLFDLKGLGSSKIKKSYVGTYTSDAIRECYIECPLFVVFRFDKFKDDTHSEVGNYFNSVGNYKFNYYAGHNNGNLVSYVLKAKDEDRQCYNTITSGKYSQVPAWYVNRVSVFPFIEETRNRVKAICLQEDWHRAQMEAEFDMSLDGQELWNTFEPSRETFRYVQKKAINPPYIS